MHEEMHFPAWISNVEICEKMPISTRWEIHNFACPHVEACVDLHSIMYISTSSNSLNLV